MAEAPPHQLENILQRKEAQLAKAKDRYDKLSYECRTIRSTIEILAPKAEQKFDRSKEYP